MPKKDRKDYLHLYLGCDIRNNITGTIVKLNSGWLHELRSNSYELNDWKLILRPLSDMTEEEAKDCHNLTTIQKSIDGKDVIGYYRENEPFLEPIQFAFLLSKHFDLFGLIDAGLAIDKTTLNKQP